MPHTTKSLIPLHCGFAPKLTPYFEEASAGALPSDCLATVLRRLGYATHWIQTPESGFERRADLVKAFGFERLTADENLDNKGFKRAGYFGFEDDILLRPTFRWIDEQQDKPFFLGMLNVTSHHPYDVPKGYPKGDWPADGKLADYYDVLKYTDDFLRKLFKGFDERGLADNTLFVVVADHGEAFGEHGLFQHGHTVHEEGLRVPMIVMGPGIAKGVRRDGLRQHVDLLPTVLEFLGLRVMAGDLPGRNLLTTEGHDKLYFSCWRKDTCRAKIDGNTKIIHHFDRRPDEAYDLTADPEEKVNLVASGKVTAAQMKAHVQDMLAWSQQVNARFDNQNQRRRRLYVTRSKPDDIGTPADISFDGWVKLIGYDVERTKLNDGDATWVTTVFRVTRDPPAQCLLWMHATGPIYQGKRKRRIADHVPVEGSHPIAKWTKGDYIVDRHWLRMKPGHPTGDYVLTFGFWDPDNNRRATPAGKGAPLTPHRGVHLATLKVTNRVDGEAGRPNPLSELDHDQRRRVRTRPPVPAPQGPAGVFGDIIALRGVELPSDATRAGVDQRWTMHFEVLGDVPRWTDIFIHVTGPEGPKGRPARNVIVKPFDGRLAVHQWRKGWHLQVHQDVGVDAGKKPGKYDVWLGFWDPNVADAHQRHVPKTGARVHAGRMHIGSFEVLPGEPAPRATPPPRPNAP